MLPAGLPHSPIPNGPLAQEPADLAATSEDEASSDEEGPLHEPNPHQALVPAGGAATNKWVLIGWPLGCAAIFAGRLQLPVN